MKEIKRAIVFQHPNALPNPLTAPRYIAFSAIPLIPIPDLVNVIRRVGQHQVHALVCQRRQDVKAISTMQDAVFGFVVYHF